MAKASSKKTGKSKKELLDEAIAEVVRGGKELHLESVDFSDPNRPKTCLEVDFPILPINHVAAIEGNAGKPIYQMSKWWARRRSSVFRSMLIAAATKAPEDPGEAAKLVWDSYYGNHQKNEAFKKLKVADIFMGGGTTIVEGARLGMQMFGNDLNPVAWLVVKNELAQVDPSEVQKLLNEIEAEVRPQTMPFYACDCPHGHRGKWTQKSTGKVMGETFDALCLKPDERVDYEYKGPEVIYTFWAKHGTCQATGCGHRTPIMSSPVIAVKSLTVKAWINRQCNKCSKTFDVEQHEARIAPNAMFVCAPDEEPHSVMDQEGHYLCPHCGEHYHDPKAKTDGVSGSLGKSKNKSIDLTVLVHPDWLKGSSGKSADGKSFGGSADDTPDSTANWLRERRQNLSLVEFRGNLPESFTCPPTNEVIRTDNKGGTVPRERYFKCMSGTCGKEQIVLEATVSTGKTRPEAPYAYQIHCPECDQSGYLNSGRYFVTDVPVSALESASHEYHRRKGDDLAEYLPTQEIPFGSRTHVKDPLPKHGYTHWRHMFNPRQLLSHALLLRAIIMAMRHNAVAATFILGAFQQFLRFNNSFSIWHKNRNCTSAFLSNSNYNPKTNTIETCLYATVGDGTWRAATSGLFDALKWKANPSELLPVSELARLSPSSASQVSTKSVKVHPGDLLTDRCQITCGSSTELSVESGSFDLVITDPPFSELIQYSELADFFYVWLRLALRNEFSGLFDKDQSPKALEAVTNNARHPEEPDEFYKRLLTECWREAARILKPAGMLAFTFHHSEDDPWVMVLESLFASGFYLEATFPIRGDETKAEGEFGSQKVEYDIIHVCRKRIDEPQEISWARLRRQILSDVRQLQDILEHHQQEGLQEADIQVIRRGKALEYYSKHYGRVYVEKGREFTVKEALTGINQLLDDQRDSSTEVPPVDAEPYTCQFLRLFADTTNLPRDQMQKFLRGTGVSPAEFEERGWCNEKSKVFHFTPPLELAQKWKGVSRQGMGRDFDQSMFLIGACYENSGIRVQDTLNSDKFIPHPATGDVIDWFTRHGGDSKMKDAAKLAKQLYTKWVASNQPKVKAAQRTFDFAEGEA